MYKVLLSNWITGKGGSAPLEHIDLVEKGQRENCVKLLFAQSWMIGKDLSFWIMPMQPEKELEMQNKQ